MINEKMDRLFGMASLLGLSTMVGRAELIAYWPFDEGEGTVAKDTIGGFDGQIIGGTWFSPGKQGAFAYEATGDEEINCSFEPTPTTKDLSLSWWMIDNHDSYGTIMDKSITDSGYGYNILLRGAEEDSPLRFRIGGWQSYGGWGEECRLPAGAYEDGEWVHITCVYDSESDTASIYVNGELPENGDFNPKTGIAGPEGYCEGVNNLDAPLLLRGGNETFDGVLDDVAIWDHALTPEEVLIVFNSGPEALIDNRPFAISAINFTPDDNLLSLTWNSREGEIYAVKYSHDLITWDNDLDDGVPGAAGESTTWEFDMSTIELEAGAPLYFRVEKQ